MSRLLIARTLNASGVMGATVGVAVSLAGIIGVVVTTPTACPESIGPARCNAAAFKAANLAAFGLIGAGVAGGLLMAGKLTDPEA
tara:strand:- start:211 stop:465 length:255 start_codon:yes stop_codon:yes gene_type:complete